jgi:hypothetical protein
MPEGKGLSGAAQFARMEAREQTDGAPGVRLVFGFAA